jgi:hypothetical protein
LRESGHVYRFQFVQHRLPGLLGETGRAFYVNSIGSNNRVHLIPLCCLAITGAVVKMY